MSELRFSALGNHFEARACRALALAMGLLFSSALFAQTEKNQDWVQFPPRVTPRQAIPKASDTQADIVQFPSLKTVQRGLKSASTYDGNKQSYTVTFGDGSTTKVTEKAISQQTLWAEDHITKITVYKFDDGSTHRTEQKIPGLIRPPIYQGEKQFIVTDYGDGTSSVVENSSVFESQVISDDQLTKLVTYLFPDGNTHKEVLPIKVTAKNSTYAGANQETLFTYSDGSTELRKFQANDSKITWRDDHVTKVTEYFFEDGTTSKEKEVVEPTIETLGYIDNQKISQLKYGDGFVKEQKQAAIDKEISWSDDKRIQLTRYKFADGSFHLTEKRVQEKLVKTEFENDVEIATYKLGDESFEVVRTTAIEKREEWWRDRISLLTHYTFPSGKVNTVIKAIQPTKTVLGYERNKQFTSLRYGDGSTDLITNTAISQSVDWHTDHISKQTTYQFEDGSTSSSVDTVLPVQLKPIYFYDQQILMTEYGDGFKSKEIIKPVSQKVVWSPERTHRTITYQFPDNSSHVDEEFVGIDGNFISKAIASKADIDAANPFVLKGFKFKGNTKFNSDQLSNALQPWMGQTVDFKSLLNASSLVANLYREKGLLANVSVPQQEVQGGLVILDVSESKLANISIRDDVPESSVSKHASDIVKANNNVGGFLELKSLEKTAILLSEIPGVKADIALKQGGNANETDVVVDIKPAKLYEGSLSADNTGSPSTGKQHVFGTLNFNGLANRGDVISLMTMKSQGSELSKIAYSEPFGPYGWRVGASSMAMNYHVITADLADLNVHGPSKGSGIEASGPLVKDKFGNINLQLTWDEKSFHNQIATGTYSNYSASVLGINLLGNVEDGLDGVNSTYGLSWISGKMNLNGSPNQAEDLAGPQTAGDFNKYKIMLKREQQLTKQTTFSTAYQGQWASKNLDSSEKFTLGGSQGVRAYGTNEASGSEGQLLNFELQHLNQIDDVVVSKAIFYDIGKVKVNKHSDFSTAYRPNLYTLKGMGLWVGFNMRNKIGLVSGRLTWSKRIGENPAANSLGLDQDGTLIHDRWWLTLSQSF